MTHRAISQSHAPIPNLAEERTKALIRQATQVRLDIQRFEAQFPELMARQDRMPRFTWQEVQRQLLSVTPEPLIPLTTGWLSGTQKLATVKPPEMVLRELICFAGILQTDEPLPGWEDSMR